MNLHKNARLTPGGRLRVVQRIESGEKATTVAEGAGVSVRTIWKWVRRFRENDGGLEDRSSRPARIARQLPRHQRRQILRSRRKRWSSLRIANHYGLPVSTVVTIQRRLGLNRLTKLEPQRPAIRYEKRRPGQLLHVDVKKLVKIAGIGPRIHGDRSIKARGKFSQLTAGEWHACGVAIGGAAYCWGRDQGYLGLGSVTSQREAPAAVSGGHAYRILSAGTMHTCGVTWIGIAYCWGSNHVGQLGDGTGSNGPVPRAVRNP